MQFVWLIPSVLFGAYLGFSTGAWHMLAMSLATALVWLVVKRFGRGNAIDGETTVSIEAEQVLIGDFALPRRQIFWRREWNDMVFRALEGERRQPSFDLQLDWVGDAAHALIVGPTGSGKSQLLKLLLRQIVADHPACSIWLFDFKGGATFLPLARLPQVQALITDIDGHQPAEVWAHIEQELSRRELVLATARVARIEDLPAGSLPRLFVLVDELAAALAEAPHAQNALVALVSRGRSLGVHFIGAGQTVQGIPRTMLANIRARLVVGEADPIDLSLLNIKRPELSEATPLTKPGWVAGRISTPLVLNSGFFFPLSARF